MPAACQIDFFRVSRICFQIFQTMTKDMTFQWLYMTIFYAILLWGERNREGALCC